LIGTTDDRQQALGPHIERRFLLASVRRAIVDAGDVALEGADAIGNRFDDMRCNAKTAGQLLVGTGELCQLMFV
jgi:hypothetical protein